MIRNPRSRSIAFAVFVVATLAYLTWRACYTLNPDAPLYSRLFLALEVYAAACALTFYAITRRRDDRQAPAPRPGIAVDVLICTYNEPASLLRQTIRRALALNYPHRTYVCDDGRRPEIRALATELGCDYITREHNHHYKAGNLNHALVHTTGELLVVLDADHLVCSDFLDKLLGYFEDPSVALVQTPQVFYNVDSFQHHFHARQRKLWHEGAIFHHAMQPGANRWNAAFFVGTGAILRRSAIESIGGFATGSVTEDAFTSMRLHAAGFRSVYHDEPVGYLIAPESLQQYLTQRLRWGQGSMQILRLQNPLTCRGLSWRQRLVYTAALSSFTQAIVHLAYYLAPALFLLGGPAPLRAREPLDLAPIVAHIIFDLAFFKLWLGPLARPLVAECFKFLNVYCFIKALGGYFMRSGRLAFKVTTKGRDGGASLRLLAPQSVLLFVNTTAFGYGVLRLTTPGDSLIGTLGFGLATLFAGAFVVIGAMTFLFAHARIAADREYTFPDQIPADLIVSGGARVPATVLRANDTDMHLLTSSSATAEGEHVAAILQLPGEHLEVAGRISRVTAARGGAVLSLELSDLSPRARDRLFDRFVECALPDLVDPIVERWRTGASPPPHRDSLYLPIQTDVL
jgi:cellulose synthase (UDP-forming)